MQTSIYNDRWPCQEAKFKEMTRHCNLKVNHEFKKDEVFNRMAAKKLKSAGKSLNYEILRGNNLQEKQEGVKRQIHTLHAILQWKPWGKVRLEPKIIW